MTEQNNYEELPQEMETQPTPKKKNAAVEVYDWVESCAVALVFVLLLFMFVLRTATVYGISMQKTLFEGERLIVLETGYTLKYEDIVVIDRTVTNQPPLIKRVIGLPGDVIDIDFDAGEVYRNGELLDEPYINEPTHLSYDIEFPQTVPEGAVFAMGDNRNHSQDSRESSIGMVDQRRVMGKAIFRFLPFSKAGAL